MVNTSRVFIIAEAGVNHNGDLAMAKKLVEAARQIGADAVKFQTFKADALVSPLAQKARYQTQTTPANESQYAMIKKLELDEAAHRALVEYCRKCEIMFLSSPFDEESADLLERLDVPMFKIPSGEITNEPFLRHVAAKQKPIILSTGMSTLEEVEEAVAWIVSLSRAPLTLLHCVTEYPAPLEQINLRAMATMRSTFGLDVGYSDHTEGTEAVAAAVALGATIIEKHFTLNKNLSGPDHKASLEPEEFQKMVVEIRAVERMLGDGNKRPAACELENRNIVRKSLVVASNIAAGTILTEDMIVIQRPGIGLSPAMKMNVIGRKIRVNATAGTVLRLDMLA